MALYDSCIECVNCWKVTRSVQAGKSAPTLVGLQLFHTFFSFEYLDKIILFQVK